jgi:hypothetical protein
MLLNKSDFRPSVPILGIFHLLAEVLIGAEHILAYRRMDAADGFLQQLL